MSNLSRAGLIIQNNKYEDIKVISDLKKYGKEILFMRYKSEYFMDYKNSILMKDNITAIIFSGIADDESFIQMVKKKGIKIKETMRFSDHHVYTKDEIGFLEKRYSADIVFITTEKDFVKIRQFKEFIRNYPVYFLKMNAEMDTGSNTLLNKLDALVK
jgi:tetraacyldisaccharide-1-P 4'-kinase